VVDGDDGNNGAGMGVDGDVKSGAAGVLGIAEDVLYIVAKMMGSLGVLPCAPSGSLVRTQCESPCCLRGGSPTAQTSDLTIKMDAPCQEKMKERRNMTYVQLYLVELTIASPQPAEL